MYSNKKYNTINYKSIFDVVCGTGAIVSLIVNSKKNIYLC
ncbi:hypothetical protein CLK_0623 [Clostridium botulinum A3 str. Loch Maree]|nr:hypothetical protein CLK_0623 [Clostridium botulinum A3 str. Loch Maree]